MREASFSDHLVAFAKDWSQRGLPTEVTHEAARLLVNQLKASVCAIQHPAVRILYDYACSTSAGREEAHVLWIGRRLSAEQACIVNAAMFEVLDFNDTYIPTFQHAVSGVLPSVLAAAETENCSGSQILTAMALGIEAELACARILMPTGYYRGFIPGGITGAVGGAVAASLLIGLPEVQMRNAIGLAMNSGCGFYQSAGSMALPYVMGMTARNGLAAASLASRGLDAPALSFEGDKAMLSAYSDEPADKIASVLSDLGKIWRISGQSYKSVPTETITHAPIECIFDVLKRANGRQVERMRFGVSGLVVKIAEERAQRFGVPTNDLEAKFDLRYCCAAAWLRGRFTLAELQDASTSDPEILQLRSRIELVEDTQHPTFNGASLDVTFTDGTRERSIVRNFRGTPENPLSDDELSDLLKKFAQDFVPEAQIDRILRLAWGLEQAESIHPLMAQLSLKQE